MLPAGYLAEHVQLRYATIVFLAERHPHAVVDTGMTREALYVAATRGSESNRLHVNVASEPPGDDASHGPVEPQSARQVLISVAHRRGAEASAHQVMASEWASA